MWKVSFEAYAYLLHQRYVSKWTALIPSIEFRVVPCLGYIIKPSHMLGTLAAVVDDHRQRTRCLFRVVLPSPFSQNPVHCLLKRTL